MPTKTYNKCVINGTTYLDLSSDTVTADKLLEGYTAHDKNGVAITGTANPQSLVITDTTDSHGGTIREITGKVVTLSTKNVTQNGTYDAEDDGYDGYTSVTVNVGGSSPTIQSLNVTPSTSQQTFNSSSVDGYKPVVVEPFYLQIKNKTYTPTTSQQTETVTFDSSDYDGLEKVNVTVDAMPTMTLPTSASASATSGYSSKATISRSTSDQYINIPTGYNSSGAYYKVNAVANGSATPAASISGTSATVSTGTNTLTLSKTVSNTPQVTAGYISSGTAGNTSVSLTASVTTKAAATITPGTSNQTISSGTYLTGTQTISGDSNLIAGNIISGKTIFGVSGSVVLQTVYTGSSAPSSSTGINGDIYIQS